LLILRIAAASFTKRLPVRNPAAGTVTSFRTGLREAKGLENVGNGRRNRGGIDFERRYLLP
jgi:hypothetical protein